MGSQNRPDERLATKTLPGPLWEVIKAVFAGENSSVALVGGTALGGFFAGHRKSDDMDLFTGDGLAQEATVVAVKQLVSLGVTLADERRSAAFYHAVATWRGHQFTISVVLDHHLFKVGTFVRTTSGVLVAAIETLLMMKSATLVSRCSEKDLFDLLWLEKHYRAVSAAERISLGHRIDGGVHGETILISLAGAKPRLEACAFAEAFGVPATVALKQIQGFRDTLISDFVVHLESKSVSAEIGRLIRRLKR